MSQVNAALMQIGEQSRRVTSAALEAMPASERLKIGDLARATGRTVRALRLYEELGLLTPPMRTEGDFRLYSPNAIKRVGWIVKLQDLGFTLASIVELVGAGAGLERGSSAMGRVKGVFEEKLAEVRWQMGKLRALEQDLLESLHYLQDCASCERGPVKEVCASCAEPGHEPHHTPSLVGGIRHKSAGSNAP